MRIFPHTILTLTVQKKKERMEKEGKPRQQRNAMNIAPYAKREARYLQGLEDPRIIMLMFGLFPCVYDPSTRTSKSRTVRLSEDDITTIERYLYEEIVPTMDFVRYLFPNTIQRMGKLCLSPDSLEDVLVFWLIHHTKAGFCNTPVCAFRAVSCTRENGVEFWTVQKSDGRQHIISNPLGIVPIQIGDMILEHNGTAVARQNAPIALALRRTLL